MRINGGRFNLTVSEIADYLYQHNLTFSNLYERVEYDDWVYYDGISRVCSSFVASVWKAGGLFGADAENIQATEFTPRDIYQMVFIDPAPEVPLECKLIDPTNPYCQIMGGYRMTFPGIGTISPYADMNEECQSLPPMYSRLPAGC